MLTLTTMAYDQRYTTPPNIGPLNVALLRQNNADDGTVSPTPQSECARYSTPPEMKPLQVKFMDVRPGFRRSSRLAGDAEVSPASSSRGSCTSDVGKHALTAVFPLCRLMTQMCGRSMAEASSFAHTEYRSPDNGPLSSHATSVMYSVLVLIAH